jgi:hypothetical protein
MRRKVCSSTPLLAERRIWLGVRAGAICCRTERSACEGVTQRMMSASSMASVRLEVTVMVAGMGKPAR